MTSMLVIMGNDKNQRKEVKAPHPPVEWDLRQLERGPTKLLETRVKRRKRQLSRKILIASKREGESTEIEHK